VDWNFMFGMWPVMSPVTEICVGCTATSVFGILINCVMIPWQNRSPGHPFFFQVTDVQGVASLLWTSAVSMGAQAFAYTPLCFYAWIEWHRAQGAAIDRGESVGWWQHRPGSVFAENRDGATPDHVDPLFIRLYFYAFFGYLMVRLPPPLSHERLLVPLISVP
jgi:hypothetical protein